MFYEHSESYRKLVNYILFGNSAEAFAANYFHWFWGNMCGKASQKEKAAPYTFIFMAIAGAAAVEAKRQSEITQKLRYADEQTKKAIEETTQRFKTVEELEKFHKDRREEWVAENGIVIKVIKKVENAIDKFL